MTASLVCDHHLKLRHPHRPLNPEPSPTSSCDTSTSPLRITYLELRHQHRPLARLLGKLERRVLACGPLLVEEALEVLQSGEEAGPVRTYGRDNKGGGVGVETGREAAGSTESGYGQTDQHNKVKI